MSSPDDPQVKPTEQRGGTTPGDAEVSEKGQWAAGARDGVVPSELGGSDAPEEMLDDDPQLRGAVLGETTGSSTPATGEGIDLEGGRRADAVTDGGAAPASSTGAAPKAAGAPGGPEPDLKDAAAGPRQADLASARDAEESPPG
jgi:hypothetical protein